MLGRFSLNEPKQFLIWTKMLTQTCQNFPPASVLRFWIQWPSTSTFTASMLRSTTEINPKQCVWCVATLLRQLIQICFESNSRKAELQLTVAFSLSLKTYSAGEKVLKSAGKPEKAEFPWCVVWYPGSYASSLFQFYVRQKLRVTNRSSEIRRAGGKSADPVCLEDNVGFLFVWLSDLGSSCKPCRNLFSRPLCLAGSVVLGDCPFQSKAFRFSHHPDSPI